MGEEPTSDSDVESRRTARRVIAGVEQTEKVQENEQRDRTREGACRESGSKMACGMVRVADDLSSVDRKGSNHQDCEVLFIINTLQVNINKQSVVYFFCRPHLTNIICCTAVWAQACGLERKTSFVIIVHLWFIRRPRLFSVVVGVLLGAVSRYCHFWYRLFGSSQP